VPLSKIQTDILRILASHRGPESYVAGSTPLNRDAPRYSAAVDIFHDRAERVLRAAEVEWLRREPAIRSLLASRNAATTKLEWVADSDYRFFPAMPDDLFGYILHPIDLATNKVAAAYGRREPRDVVDLITAHERILPVGALVWAAVDKAPGLTPEGVINEIRRVARYTEADFRDIVSDTPVDAAATMTRLREILQEADAFVRRMPTEKVGLLFLKHGRVVQPDPDHLAAYQTHAGQRGGHWPSGYEIDAAMLERHGKNPNVQGQK
jgi:hypothetical protein